MSDQEHIPLDSSPEVRARHPMETDGSGRPSVNRDSHGVRSSTSASKSLEEERFPSKERGEDRTTLTPVRLDAILPMPRCVKGVCDTYRVVMVVFPTKNDDPIMQKRDGSRSFLASWKHRLLRVASSGEAHSSLFTTS